MTDGFGPGGPFDHADRGNRRIRGVFATCQTCRPGAAAAFVHPRARDLRPIRRAGADAGLIGQPDLARFRTDRRGPER